MGWPKRTYSMPADTLARFEREVPRGKRATVLSELLANWLDARRRERLRRDIVQGCRDMSEIYLETEREFHPLEEEVQRALDSSAAKGRGRARSSRSGRRI